MKARVVEAREESFAYAGKRFDSVPDSCYFGARFYGPTTDRFVVQDSYSGAQ